MEKIVDVKMETEDNMGHFQLTSEIEIKEENIDFLDTENNVKESELNLPVISQSVSKNVELTMSNKNEVNFELTRHNLMPQDEVELPSAEDLGLLAELTTHNIHNEEPINNNTKYNLSNMCRICGHSRDSLKDIYSRTSVLSLLIRRYLPAIKVTQSDQLPLKVCLPCRSTIFAFHEIQYGLDNAKLQSEQHADSPLLLCRVCRTSSDNMMYIFSEEACVTLQLPMLVAACLPQLKVSRSDSVSLHMCLRCRTTLHSFNARKQQCVAVEDKMRNILRTLESWKPPKEIAKNKLSRSGSESYLVSGLALQADPTTEVRDCITPKPPYTCQIKCCSWNSEPLIYRQKVIAIREHYTIDHNVSLCEYCFLIFVTNELKIEHVRKWHMIPCNICNITFLGYKTLNDHKVKLHSPIIPKSVDGKFQCEYCYAILSTKYLLNTHLSVKHHIFVSIKCNQVFRSDVERQQHDLENHDAFCSLCNSPISSDRGMRNHITLQHKNQQVRQLVLKLPPTPATSISYTCKICTRKLPTKNSLKHHCFWFHKKYICEFCFFVFPKRELEDLHFKQNHKHECVECNMKLNTSLEVDIHIKTMHPDLQCCFCEFCGQSFNDRDTLENHRLTHDIKNNNNLRSTSELCDVCGKFCYDKNTLMKHKELHIRSENNITSTCPYCDRNFKNIPGLNLHITLKHIGKPEVEKNFQCKICKKYFECFNKLEEHMVRHYKYKCDMCNIQYMLRVNLEEHVQEIHCPPVAYKCLECGKILCSEQELHLHIQCAHNTPSGQVSHSQVPVLRCQLCMNVFLNKQLLKSHIKKHHLKGKKITNKFRRKPMGRKPYLERV